MKWFALLLCAPALGPGPLRPHRQRRPRARQLAHLFRQLPGPPFLAAFADHAGQRRRPAREVGLSDGVPRRSLAHRGRWRDVRQRPQHRRGARPSHRPRALDVEAAHSEGLPEHRIRPGESRPGHPGWPDLRRHARLLPGRPRRQERPRTMVVQGRRLQARIQHDAGAARHPRQSPRRRQRRRNRHSRLRGCVRREDRQPRVALLHHSRTRRTGQRHLAR